MAGRGLRCVINNRPDNEGEGQPSSEAMRTAAEASGFEYHHLPVVSGQIRGPALAFCRTGTRSTSLWALAEAHRLDPQVLLQTAKQATTTSPVYCLGWSSTGNRPPQHSFARAH
ncbi:sulfur transferase domain-containing protein [Pseudomonas stutzeri]|uniref:beta-lactamase hydrolase domain-containing protein n=1 Tax=Stutzerimonas stutzeri TaxID=316 RepID=UPI00210BA219|nr:sulfur transferase domain-containing protein [Stutzerimonas stutzeri]